MRISLGPLGVFSRLSNMKSLLTALVAALLCISAPAYAADPPQSMEGQWVGAFQSYPGIVQMTVEVPAATSSSNVTDVNLRFEPVGVGRGPIGVATGRISYNPISGTMTLTASADARRIGLRVSEFHGFYDAETGAFGGFMTNAPTDASPFFVLTTPKRAKKLIFDPLKKVQPKQRRIVLPFRGGYDQKVLQRWAQRFVDEYPDVRAYHTESGRLFLLARKMFADEHFEAHFGKTFDGLGSGKRGRIAMELTRVQPPRSNFPEEEYRGVLRAVERGFSDMIGTYTSTDIQLSVLSYRHLSGWQRGTIERLGDLEEDRASFEAGLMIDASTRSLNQFLWPSEQGRFADAIAQNLGRMARGPLVEEVDAAIADANGINGAVALQRMLNTTAYQGASVAGPVQLGTLIRWAPDTWTEQSPRLASKLDELIGQVTTDARNALALPGTPSASPAAARERLVSGRQWYSQNTVLINSFSNRPELRSLISELTEQREGDLAQLLPELTTQLKAVGSVAEAQRFGQELVIGPDLQASATWSRLNTVRSQRIGELNYEAELARIGEGPFGVGYPGAAYLNALYRADNARLSQQDSEVIQPITRFLRNMMNQTGLGALMQFASGGAAGAGAMDSLIEAEARRYTVANSLAGFFIVAYERVYPECMDANPRRYSITTTWETVVSNGFGVEQYRYPSGSSTEYFTINRRHAAAFEKLDGGGADPDQVNFTNALFGAFLPADMRTTFQTVSDTLNGLRQAMTEYGCNDPVIKQIERNMINRVMSR